MEQQDGVAVGLPLAWGLALLTAGLLLCFVGARAMRLAAACAGFGTGAVLADALGGGPVAALVVGVAGAAAGLGLLGLVAGAGFVVVGAAAAGAVAASAIRTTAPVGWNPVLVVVVVLAAALLGGLGAAAARNPVLAVLTALAGSAIALRGVVAIGPEWLAFLREPSTAAGGVGASAAWLGLAVAGWLVQRRRGSPARPAP